MICREGSGSGHGVSLTPGEAHESALKQAETDAMKRALVTFGNPFGLALYDKEQHGVRRTAAPKSKAIDGQQVSWVAVSSAGEPISKHADPIRFCSAIRQKIETAKTEEEIKALWARNRDKVARLSRDLPELKTEKDEHYGDILNSLYRKRLQELTKQTEAARGQQEGVTARSRGAKTVVAIPDKTRRVRDKEHLRFVASQPCLVCGRVPSQAHHIRFAQPKALGRKVSDEWVVPLCSGHHRGLHDTGNEKSWWKQHGIGPMVEAARLWQETHGEGETKSQEPARV